jgi:hypothetical protein
MLLVLLVLEQPVTLLKINQVMLLNIFSPLHLGLVLELLLILSKFLLLITLSSPSQKLQILLLVLYMELGPLLLLQLVPVFNLVLLMQMLLYQ